ncbi:DsbA family protein [Streptomyces sp. NPDC026673]|uniref:mycothiol-dependent nitroreductase Rv2466c family protein n=1 Tax=Streptomyces sp. NPDC026673 TaxID=3155724 RepID=UPI0033CC6AE5
MNESRPRTPVDFWFDPVCPWTWLSSRWMLEVERIRPVDVTWRVMSLAVLNEDRLDQLPDRIRELMGLAWAPVRVLTAASQAHGPEVTEPLYTAMGTRFHQLQQPRTRPTIEAALRDVGLPLGLADAGDTDAFDARVRASHQEAIDLVGADVGSPVVAVPGPDAARTAFFGPVVSPAPKGEEAGRLWDAATVLASMPGFYEIKRTRTAGPVFD